MNVATGLNGSRSNGAGTPTSYRTSQGRPSIDAVNFDVTRETPRSATEVDDLHTRAEIARAFVKLSDTLNETFGIDSNLSHLVEVCLQLVPGADVSVAIADDSGKLRIAASSCERKVVIEQYQIDHLQGPTIETYATGEASIVEDFDAVSDWGQFAQLAKVVGYHAIQSIPLHRRGETIGVLSVAETTVRARPPMQLMLLEALAEGTTIGILNHRAYASANELSRQLQGALTSRVLIEQAKGAVAARLGITVDEAFDMLRRYARGSNRKLNDVSRAIMSGDLATHELWGTRRKSNRGAVGAKV